MTVTDPAEHSDWSDYIALGCLALASAIDNLEGVAAIYIDATVVPFQQVLDLITEEHEQILAVAAGALTASYEAAVLLFDHVKEVDSNVATIVGNDHFTALARECMEDANSIDYGFIGNEVVGPFTDLIAALSTGRSVGPLPGLVRRQGSHLDITRQAAEPVFNGYDLNIVDRWRDHSSLYQDGFQRRIAPRVLEMFNRRVRAGTTVDIGRGCIKFANDDACSFCSIQFGGLWKNALSPVEAWGAIERAYNAGYDYLYLTADELPLTFGALLTGMQADQPAWWRSLADDDRPMLVGYARADGMADPRRAAQLRLLGVRQVMIGMDAGTPTGLAAMNKPLHARRRSLFAASETLYAKNLEAIRVAREVGMSIRAGFVVGHIGLTRRLLDESQEMMVALIEEGRDVLAAIDIEVLSPQPGARDFEYMINPDLASRTASDLNLPIADESELAGLAQRWRRRARIEPEMAMRDYTAHLMPDLSFSDLVQARSRVRAAAQQHGVAVGEPSP